MKRLLRSSKGDKKHHESSNQKVSPSSSNQKKFWGSSSILQNVENQNRIRSGSHPQIRHLAMENHNGPIQRATMDEIRKEVTYVGDDFKHPATLSASSPDLPGMPLPPQSPRQLQSAHTNYNDAGMRTNEAIHQDDLSPRNPYLSSPQFSRLSTDLGGSEYSSHQFMPRPATPMNLSQPMTSWPEHDSSLSEMHEDAPSQPELLLERKVPPLPPREPMYTSAFSDNNNNNDNDKNDAFPPRTTSVLSSSAPKPPSIDTMSSNVQRNRFFGRSGVTNREMSAPATGSPFTTGSDSTVPFGTAGEQENEGFDYPIEVPVQMQRTSSAHSSEASNRRVISERIKNLATKFSQANVSESSDQTPPTPPLHPRPSYSPSVSERVSKFNQSESPIDPRKAGLLGNFGESPSSIRTGMHSRSGSAAPSIGRSTEKTQPFAVSAPDRERLGDSRPRAESIKYEATITTAASTSYASNLNSPDIQLSDRLYNAYPRPRISTKSAANELQSTMAAGVQIAFNQSSPSLNVSETPGVPSSYRGVRAKGPIRRRASVRNTFDESSTTPDTPGMARSTSTASSHTSNSQSIVSQSSFKRCSISEQKSNEKAPTLTESPITKDQSSAQTSPSETGSIRRAGSIITGRPLSTTVASDFNVASILSSHSYDLSSSIRPRALSYTPDPSLSISVINQKASNHTNIRDLVGENFGRPEYLKQILGSDDTFAKHLSKKMMNSLHTVSMLDDSLVKAIRKGSTNSLADQSASGDSFEQSEKAQIQSAAELVESTMNSIDVVKILSLPEYERYLREIPFIKSRLQSSRTRLTLEIRMRDAAKNLVELNVAGAPSKLKNKSQKHSEIEELNLANIKVQQTEVEVSGLSTKLRLMEVALRDHQVAVLVSAIKTLVSNSVVLEKNVLECSTVMHTRITELEKQLDEQKSQSAQEKEQLEKSHQRTKTELEEEVRKLRNKNHEVTSRRISDEADIQGSSSNLSLHTASMNIERLNGQLTVLKEQKETSENRIRTLEAKLDDAMLREHEVRNQVKEMREQALEMAEVSRQRIEDATKNINIHKACLAAFSSGVGRTLGPLKSLKDIQQQQQQSKQKSNDDNDSDDDTTLNNTPTATPIFCPKEIVSEDEITIDRIEHIISSNNCTDISSSLIDDDSTSGKEGSAANDFKWSPSTVSNAMNLISAAISGCAHYYSDARNVQVTNGRLLSELRTEKRLREAQALAISQQREKLKVAQLSSSPDPQNNGEAMKALETKLAKEQKEWNEREKQYISDIDSLEKKTKKLEADIAEASGSALVLGAISRDSDEDKKQIKVLLGKVSDLETEFIQARQDLEEMTTENDKLQTRIVQLRSLQGRLDNAESDIRAKQEEIERLSRLETDLRRQLAETEGLETELAEARKELENERATLSSKETELEDYIKKFKDSNTQLEKTSARLVAIQTEKEQVANRSADHKRGDSILDRDNDNPASLFTSKAKCTDAQTMTVVNIGDDIISDDVAQVHMAYSEKLMQKEDELRNCKDDLDAIRKHSEEIEAVLFSLIPSNYSNTLGDMSGNNNRLYRPTSSSSNNAIQHSKTFPATSSSPKDGSLRNLPSVLFKGLRTNYLGLGSSPDLSNLPSSSAETQSLRSISGALHRNGNSLKRVPSTQSFSFSGRRPGTPSLDEAKAAIGSAAPNHPSIYSDNDISVLSVVQGLVGLSHAASAEVKRLKDLICDIEDRSRETRLELIDANDKLNNLKRYCEKRANKEEKIQEDIMHVLGQITLMRQKVVQLEEEKRSYEKEARMLQNKCRLAESKTTDEVVRLIVERVGQSKWATGAARSDGTSLDEKIDATGERGVPLAEKENERQGNSKFAALSAIQISHPEAKEIRAEFNELLHQVISRRDEDLDRIQKLADSLRRDSRKAENAEMQRSWNMATRGVQTV